MWASDNNEDYPPDLQSLVDAHLIDPEVLRSPLGPVHGAPHDYAYRVGARNTIDAAEIVVFDMAAMQSGHPRIATGFADGHVDSLTPEELTARLNDPKNIAFRDQLQGSH
jgi:hypothetical protein